MNSQKLVASGMSLNHNYELADGVLDILAAKRVQSIALCSGARNAPLISLLKNDSRFEVLHFVDERSAAFFILGRAKRGELAAVCCTSGTAVAELLPALVEAYYAGLSLIIITADRPVTFRGSGAPQCIDQMGIFSSYVNKGFDISKPDDLLLAQDTSFNEGSVQYNICFAEPLLPAEFHDLAMDLNSKINSDSHGGMIPVAKGEKAMNPKSKVHSGDSCYSKRLADFLENSNNPVVIIGQLKSWQHSEVLHFLEKNDYLVVAETLSGLRENRIIEARQLLSGDRILQRALAQNLIDGVIRIGGIPTLRFWRDLETMSVKLPVLSISDVPFSGLSFDKAAPLEYGALAAITNVKKTTEVPAEAGEARKNESSLLCTHSELVNKLLLFDRQKYSAMSQLLRQHPTSEPALIHSLSCNLSKNTHLFLGNSLPIREWDAFASRAQEYIVTGNRGANGIDGLLSSAFGWGTSHGPLWIVVGDLSALYDLNALWIASQVPDLEWKIIVVNNGGGRIFKRIFSDKAFENEHDFHFEYWAKMFQCDYLKISEPNQLHNITAMSNGIVEIIPNNEVTDTFWNKVDELWRL